MEIRAYLDWSRIAGLTTAEKEICELIGDRLIAVADETKDFDADVFSTRKGDPLRRVIYPRKAIVDKLGDTGGRQGREFGDFARDTLAPST